MMYVRVQTKSDSSPLQSLAQLPTVADANYDPVTYIKELEGTAKRQHISDVLEHTLGKLKIALCLPMLLRNNGAILKPHLNIQDMAVVNKCSRYPSEVQNHLMETTTDGGNTAWYKGSTKTKTVGKKDAMFSWANTIAKFNPKMKSMEMDVETRHDPDVCCAVELLWNKPVIRVLVRDQLLSQIAPAAQNFLDCFCFLQTNMLDRMATSLRQQDQHLMDMRQNWRRNTKNIEQIQLFDNRLVNHQGHWKHLFTQKNKEILRYQELIDRTRDQSKEHVRRKAIESDQQMALEWRRSQVKMYDLKRDEQFLSEDLSDLIVRHLRQEKDLRARRQRFDSILKTTLEKYDGAMIELQEELDTVRKEYGEELAEKTELQKLFDKQDEMYVVLMAEKEEEEQYVLNKLMHKCIVNRAVRSIQRYWRAYRVRKLANRSNKQKRKGKSKTAGKGSKGKKKAK